MEGCAGRRRAGDGSLSPRGRIVIWGRETGRAMWMRAPLRMRPVQHRRGGRNPHAGSFAAGPLIYLPSIDPSTVGRFIRVSVDLVRRSTSVPHRHHSIRRAAIALRDPRRMGLGRSTSGRADPDSLAPRLLRAGRSRRCRARASLRPRVNSKGPAVIDACREDDAAGPRNDCLTATDERQRIIGIRMIHPLPPCTAVRRSTVVRSIRRSVISRPRSAIGHPRSLRQRQALDRSPSGPVISCGRSTCRPALHRRPSIRRLPIRDQP